MGKSSDRCYTGDNGTMRQMDVHLISGVHPHAVVWEKPMNHSLSLLHLTAVFTKRLTVGAHSHQGIKPAHSRGGQRQQQRLHEESSPYWLGQ